MKKVLLFTTTLSFSFTQLMSSAQSACVSTPTCSELGYTESSCPNGGLKCPFGNTWNCEITNYKDKITELEKIIEELKTELKQCQTPDCEVGNILYSDKTCSPDVISDKKPIGVVFDCQKKLAIGIEESEEYWSTTDFDVSGLNNILSVIEALQDLDGKKNTSTVLAYCKTNGYSCPAFEYVNSHKTEGTKAGDWYLPAMGELYIIYNNRDVLNKALEKIGGTNLGTSSFYWSSSEYSNGYAWGIDIFNRDVRKGGRHGNYYVRPVLAF